MFLSSPPRCKIPIFGYSLYRRNIAIAEQGGQDTVGIDSGGDSAACIKKSLEYPTGLIRRRSSVIDDFTQCTTLVTEGTTTIIPLTGQDIRMIQEIGSNFGDVNYDSFVQVS